MGAGLAEPLIEGDTPGASPSISSPSRAPRAGLPFSAVLGLVSALCILIVAKGQLRDVDLYWHLLAGEAMASGVPPDSVGTDWALAPSPLDWTTTQAVAELVLYWVHTAGGWAALAALRVITACIAIAVLAQTTLVGRPKSLAGLPFAMAAITVALVSQERPQQATLVGAAALGGVLVNGLRSGRLPRWYLVVPVTVLWANFHGGWILMPVVLGLIAFGRFLDHGRRDQAGRRALSLTLGTLAAGALTPAGLAGLTAPFRIRAAAELIIEWQPTEPTSAIGIFTVGMLVLVGLGWARSDRVPISELVAVFACLVFSWTAWRNVAPGLALLAPITAQRLVDAFPRVRAQEPRWSAPVGVSIAVAISLLSLVGIASRDHLPRDKYPMTLLAAVAELPSGQRVLNHYPLGGMLLYFGGPATKVGIDGRTDRYGAEYLRAYRGLPFLQGDWAPLLADLKPTSALIERKTGLAYYLSEVRGWKQVGDEERGYVLLVDLNAR